MPMSLDMLRRAESEGVSAMVMTPHVRSHNEEERDELHAQRFAELQSAAADAGITIELFLGAELALRFGLAEVARWPNTALADGPYVLVDLPLGPLPTEGGIEQGVFELRAAGQRPPHRCFSRWDASNSSAAMVMSWRSVRCRCRTHGG